MQEYFEERNNDTTPDNDEENEGENSGSAATQDSHLMDANDPRASEEQKQDLINILNQSSKTKMELSKQNVENIDREKVEKTNDVFGRNLWEFALLEKHDKDAVPLVFHLLVGYF